MFWHETQENDINIFPYNKSDFMMLSTTKNLKESEKKSENILDLSDQYQVNTIVSTDWGPGKIVSVDRIGKKVVVKIEGEEKEFNMHELRTKTQIMVHIYFKNLDLLDKRIIFLTNISAGDTVLDMKKRVANILGTSADCITLVHGGFKMTSNNQKFSEVGFYDNDNLLAVVNGVCNY